MGPAIRTLLREKANILKKTNPLTWIEPEMSIEQVVRDAAPR
jgi:hypothetical protein